MTDEQIKHMTERFLMWKLPANFNPDNGISAQRPNYGPGVVWEPLGTNLFDYTQAEAMVRHMVEGMSPSLAGEAWARLETWGEAQKVCQRGLDGLTFASDVSEERRAAVRSGIEFCIAAIHQASRHDPKAAPPLGSLPPAHDAGEANVERVALGKANVELRLIEATSCEPDIRKAACKAADAIASALTTLERTTDAG